MISGQNKTPWFITTPQYTKLNDERLKYHYRMSFGRVVYTTHDNDIAAYYKLSGCKVSTLFIPPRCGTVIVE